MATIDSKDFINKLIAGRGRIDPEDAPDNPWAERIVEYDNMVGKPAWGVTFEGEDHGRYLRASEYVNNPRIIWERKAHAARMRA